MKMLDLEGQWTDLLATNNITSIVRGMKNINKNDKAHVDETLTSFSCWLQRTAEFTKKELMSLCFSRCQGLWMFLNRYSSRRVHNLLQKLRSLITLVQWVRKTLMVNSGPSWPVGKDTSNTRRSCWNREDKDLKKLLWLGRLVEWWSLMGLLPKHPESKGEKQIAHMWKEINQCHRKTGLTDVEDQRGISVVQGLVTHLVKQHGYLWPPDSSGQQCYPPPSLKALLKLVLVPNVDTQSVQAVIMYFILDVAKFLQCRNDLFKSFCHVFSIPATFSHQIKAFWMLDHGQIKAAMDLLLSPRIALPRFSWQHRSVLKSLLSRKEHLLAFRYLHLTSPAVESVEDVKLSAQVLLQNSCVSEAWALIKRYHSEEMVTHFLQVSKDLGLREEASKCIAYEVQSENDGGVSLQLKVAPPCPLSAALCRAQSKRALSVEELLQILTQAVAELRLPPPSAVRELAWPHRTQRETKADSSEVFLSTEVPFLRSPSPSIVETAARSEDYNQPENPDHPSSCPSLVPPIHGQRRVSFSSVSSMSPIRKDQTFSYESTVTLQQISLLLNHGQEEDEEVSQISQVSVAAEEFPDCHEWTLEGAAVPVIDHPYVPHSFRNRFYSTDCCIDLPSLPEEIIQTPPTKPAELEDSEIFQETGSTIPSTLPQDEPQKEACELQAEDLSRETSHNSVNVDDQTNLSDRTMEGGSQAVLKSENQSVPPVGPSYPPSHSLLPYINFTQHTEDTRSGPQADKDSTAGRSSAGKVSVRSRRARKNKRVK